MAPVHDEDDTVPATLEELRPWLRDMRADLRRNTEATERVEAATAEIVEVLAAAKGFWSVVSWIGDAGVKVGKFAIACTLAGGAVWLWVKGFFETRVGGQ